MAFSDKNNLLSLYNAIAGAHYQNPEALNIVTLENAVYMGMKTTLPLCWKPVSICMNISLLTTPIFPLRDLFLYCKRISVSYKSENPVFIYLTDHTDSKISCIL